MPLRLILLVLCLSQLAGCAVLTSPMSWNDKVLSGISPSELKVNGKEPSDENGKTFEQRRAAASSLADVITLANDTSAALQSKLGDLRTQLDRKSGGNYGWGALGAAAALSNLHVSALKGIGFAGGTHVAFSDRLTPGAQMDIVYKALDSVACVGTVAGRHSAAEKNISTNLNILKIELGLADIQSKEGNFPGHIDYLWKMQSILSNAQRQLDVLSQKSAQSQNVSTELKAATEKFVDAMKTAAVKASARLAGVAKADQAFQEACKDPKSDACLAKKGKDVAPFLTSLNYISVVQDADEKAAKIALDLAACGAN
jgi:hypothetical protein